MYKNVLNVAASVSRQFFKNNDWSISGGFSGGGSELGFFSLNFI